MEGVVIQMAAEESAGIRPREETTREGILRLIMERGPISAAELAQLAILTPAGVRRHLVALEDAGAITECEKPGQREARAGRPARYYVATDTGQDAGATSYHTMANAALDFLRENLGEAGVEEFARRRERSLVARYRDALGDTENPAERLRRLARALTQDGYAASVRDVPGTQDGPRQMIQLCQGRCPLRDVATHHHFLCAAETRAFHELLGVPVQRLATIASGSHVCTVTLHADSV
ncbi:helix-turn-helix transcriptional regulator [Schaalia turicensis]|uniref:helix-turn-helix transcriptional regulator n=1 Tax=Schaalia turicensis TaxID=131111 RepID=UPI0036BA6CFD